MSMNEKEAYIVSLDRNIPLKHLNLMFNIDQRLYNCIKTKFQDISNIIQLLYHVEYKSDQIEAMINLLKRHKLHGQVELFPSESIGDLINNYSKNPYFSTHTSLHTIKPFTDICLTCQQPLELKFKEHVYVFKIETVENGCTYSARCCHVDYYSNGYVRGSKQFITRDALNSVVNIFIWVERMRTQLN
ncbi:unnamed protein product [Didymodactylos carnosus]|uniref:Uncharacterized protein n=1 Tax=Didymodactylos carnosus TaxID=1234261 RepID=A0A8S2DDM7_9BILA|nr:unnamed protein product [Didymodactylos carnosus]CAF3655319.1 unnamed protein product [Didymodactylos carnosus]